MLKFRLVYLAVLFYTVTACNPARSTFGKDAIIEITLLQMNDVYEISPLSDGSGGLARVATIRKELLAKNPNTFTVLCGDFISPSVIGSLKNEGKWIRGKQMIESLNAVGVDWVVFGNHEFDYKDPKDLQARIDESTFQWLGANVRFKKDSLSAIIPFFKNNADGTKTNCPDQLVIPVKDADGTSINLGVFGVLIDSGRKPWAIYSDWNEVAKKSRELLRPQTDVCIGLTHLLAEDDKKLAALLPDVPLLMGGHDHDQQIHKVGPVTVAKADANAKTVYVHTIRYDKKTKQTTLYSQIRVVNASIPDDPATAAVVDKWEKIKQTSLTTSGFDPNKTVITLKEPLDCREGIIRHEQCPVGDQIAGAMMAAARRSPDCAIFNAGSIRVDDILTGSLNEIDIIRILPFGGTIVEVEMTGAMLKRTLDAGKNNKGTGGFLQTARIKQDNKGERWIINQKILDEERTYKVAIADFLLTGDEKGLGFLKTNPQSSSVGKTDNPGIPATYYPDPKDSKDVRNDIRKALIAFWRE